MKILALSTIVISFSLLGCSSTGSDEAELALWKQCRPLYSTADLQCWYGGKGTPISQCEFANEDPPGCVGAAAAAYYNAGNFDMSEQFQVERGEERIDQPKWVQFKVASDGNGGYGQRRWSAAGGPPRIEYEKQLAPNTTPRHPVAPPQAD